MFGFNSLIFIGHIVQVKIRKCCLQKGFLEMAFENAVKLDNSFALNTVVVSSAYLKATL